MQIVNLKCTLITCKSTAVKCIILCNICTSICLKKTSNGLLSGAEEACRAHNPKVVGSKPTLAISFCIMITRIMLKPFSSTY